MTQPIIQRFAILCVAILTAAVLLPLSRPIFAGQQVHTPKLTQRQKDQLRHISRNLKASQQKLNNVKQALHASNIHVTAKGALKRLPPKQRAQLQREADRLNHTINHLVQQSKKVQGH